MGWLKYLNTGKVRTLATNVVAGAISAGTLLYKSSKWVTGISSFISTAALNKYIWETLNGIETANKENLKYLKDEGVEDLELKFGTESTAYILTIIAKSFNTAAVTASGINFLLMLTNHYTDNAKLQEPDTLLSTMIVINTASLVGFIFLMILGDRSADIAASCQTDKEEKLQKKLVEAKQKLQKFIDAQKNKNDIGRLPEDLEEKKSSPPIKLVPQPIMSPPIIEETEMAGLVL